MNKTMRDALEKSIRHWIRMAEGKRRVVLNAFGYYNLEKPTGEYCALCRACGLTFDESADCRKCPVYKKTGEANCFKTPYGNAAAAWDDYGPDSPEFKKAAWKEVEFLKSLGEEA